jgi:hypothetical protein
LAVLFGRSLPPPPLEVVVDSLGGSLAPPDLGRLVRADKLFDVAMSKIFAQIPLVDAILVHFHAASLVLFFVHCGAEDMH